MQQALFRAQMELAEEMDLPVIIHDREAHADCLRIVRDYPAVRGVFHCYSGSAESAQILISLGYMVSFTGNITFKNARRAPEVIAKIPLEHMMIETDAPYMAPAPFRGKRCDSGMVYRVARRLPRSRPAPLRGRADHKGERQAPLRHQRGMSALHFAIPAPQQEAAVLDYLREHRAAGEETLCAAALLERQRGYADWLAYLRRSGRGAGGRPRSGWSSGGWRGASSACSTCAMPAAGSRRMWAGTSATHCAPRRAAGATRRRCCRRRCCNTRPGVFPG